MHKKRYPSSIAKTTSFWRSPAIKALVLAAGGLSLLAFLSFSHLSSSPPSSPPQSLSHHQDDDLSSSTKVECIVLDEGVVEEKLEVTHHTVQRGDSLYSILSQNGLSPAQIHNVTEMLEGEFSVRGFRPGQSYEVAHDREGEFRSFSCQLNRAHVLNIERDADTGEFLVWSDVLEHETRLASLQGTISSSLSNHLKNHERTALAGRLKTIFNGQIDFRRDIQPGSSYQVLFEEQWIGDEFFGAKEVLAAEITIRNRRHTAYRFEDSNGDIGYYDEKGNSLQAFFLNKPLNYSRISSGFGHRIHPIRGTRHFHGGVDLVAPTGTPVHAVADGTVVFSGRNGTAGNMITLRHAHNYQTKYLHLSRFAQNITNGSRVRKGDVIGYVGATGAATGPHLCFRVLHHGKLVNPLQALASASSPRKAVAKSDMDRFKIQVAHFKAQIEEQDTLLAGRRASGDTSSSSSL